MIDWNKPIEMKWSSTHWIPAKRIGVLNNVNRNVIQYTLPTNTEDIALFPEEHPDIRNKTTRYTGWINLFRYKGTYTECSDPFTTKEEAMEARSRNFGIHYIGEPIEISWQE